MGRLRAIYSEGCNKKICEFDIPKNQNYGCISRETLKSILLKKVMLFVKFDKLCQTKTL